MTKIEFWLRFISDLQAIFAKYTSATHSRPQLSPYHNLAKVWLESGQRTTISHSNFPSKISLLVAGSRWQGFPSDSIRCSNIAFETSDR